MRRVLNVDRDVIKTVHGRGYVFTSEVTGASIEPDAVDRPGLESAPRQLGPARPTSLSGWGPSDDEAQTVVVVIDDDPDIRDALRGLLRAVGLCVESFASVQEFLDSDLRISPGAWFSTSGCPDKAARVSRGTGKAICTCRLFSLAVTPMCRCRFGR